MITHWYPSLRENAFIRAINRFLYSGWYFFAVAALMAMSNLFSLEIVTYWLFLLFAGNIFKLRNANKSFIHTPHGIK